jgi:hypothetical protein
MGFLIETKIDIKNIPCTEKLDFLRIAQKIFSTGVWKIPKKRIGNGNFNHVFRMRTC